MKEQLQILITWLDEMSTEGLHKTSSDLYEMIMLISSLRGRLKTA